MTKQKTILVMGTFDTKSDELAFLRTCIERLGGSVLTMDVSVLGGSPAPTDVTKNDVAAAAGSTIERIIALGDESRAMQVMADGASALVRKLHADGRLDGLIAIGGTMGTDLALDCALALPMGVPKYIVSTVAFSPLIQPERLAADVQMILWAGGLYGLNAVCRATLSQAAGAVLGATLAAEWSPTERPLIGMTSLGKSCLSYMVALKPELERRGFEVAIFHATGMGGRAFESLAAQGAFCAVMDFALPELGNHINGSVVTAGPDRLMNAGRAGIPQLVAPGAIDLVDLPTWQVMPDKWAGRPYHAHNRLIASVALNPAERRETARAIGNRLTGSSAPVHVILPLAGIEEWDRKGEAAHDPEGLNAFIDEMRRVVRPPAQMSEIDAHINDELFCETALRIFDDWVAAGIVAT